MIDRLIDIEQRKGRWRRLGGFVFLVSKDG